MISHDQNISQHTEKQVCTEQVTTRQKCGKA